MGKRSDFVRRERDFYATPYEAFMPLKEHLPQKPFGFAEPCAGDGALVDHIEETTDGWCTWASDIEPKDKGILLRGFNDVSQEDCYEADYIITNPPWDRKMLHPMIEHFVRLKPTWLLFDADWIHTKQSKPYQHLIQKIVSIGRVKWIPGTKSVGKDNCCWYLFDEYYNGDTKFYGKK